MVKTNENSIINQEICITPRANLDLINDNQLKNENNSNTGTLFV
mgnify:CR=1 FL=1